MQICRIGVPNYGYCIPQIMRFSFFIKRFIYLVIVLLSASYLSFWICKNTYSDPIENWCLRQGGDGKIEDCKEKAASKAKIKEWRLDLPTFYGEITATSEPDTFYKISDRLWQKSATELLAKNGNWQIIQQYYLAIKALEKKENAFSDSLSEPYYAKWNQAKDISIQLIYKTDNEIVKEDLDSLKSIFLSFPAFQTFLPAVLEIQNLHSLIEKDKSQRYRNYLPNFHFYGTNNQYHQWMIHFIQGDWGNSYRTDEPVKTRIYNHIGHSLLFALLSFCIIYLLGLPLGILKAMYPNSLFDRIFTSISLFIHSIPNFLLGIFLLFFFANPLVFDWFLSQYHFSGTWWQRATLPLVAYSLGGIINLSQIMSAKISEILKEDYIQTAKAKGLSVWQVVLVHALKNALLPIFTMAAGLLPSLIGGSVILETIFGIKGMGYEYFEAIHQLDIPFILAVQFLTTFLAVCGFLFSDTLSIWVDKRVNL